MAPPRLFSDRESFIAEERAARQRWLEMSPVRRAALLLLVRDQLMQMIVDPESWLPVSLAPGSPAWVDVHLLVELKDLSDTEADALVELERRRETRRGALVEMERELRANQP